MATLPIPLNTPAIGMPGIKSREPTSGLASEDINHRSETGEGPSVLVMWAYFLGLASVAVVVVGGQFPWFTLAPAIGLLMAAHFRHVEAKFKRQSSGGGGTK